jgi:hypothetical protein
LLGFIERAGLVRRDVARAGRAFLQDGEALREGGGRAAHRDRDRHGQ